MNKQCSNRKLSWGWVGVADLANFVLTQVEDERCNFQMPFVSI
jgi:hypothetical protein